MERRRKQRESGQEARDAKVAAGEAKKAEAAAQSQMDQMHQMSAMLEQVKSQWAQQQKLMAQSNMQKNMIQNLMMFYNNFDTRVRIVMSIKEIGNNWRP